MTTLFLPDDAERARAEEALRFSEAKFAGIVGIASDAIVSVDESQRVVLFNQGAEQIFGYTEEEILGQPLDVLLPQRFHAVHRRHLQTFGASPVVARRMAQRQEIFGRRKSGEEFPAEASISKLEVGGRRFFTAVLRDVTERKETEREIRELLLREREARAEAEAATRARDDVLRVVSHDLGNSLSAILVTTGVLLRTLPDAADLDARKRIASIRHLAEHMQRLRQDLLDAATIEAGGLAIEPGPQDPEALIEETLDNFASLAAERGICLTGGVREPCSEVLADRERILQVFANLVGNAIKFTPEGGRIEVGAEHGADGTVLFRVSDTGTGIAPDHLPHIFDRFWKTQGGNRQGAGLGLAIAKGIVDAHGGTLWAESPVGQGSTFFFALPTRE